MEENENNLLIFPGIFIGRTFKSFNDFKAAMNIYESTKFLQYHHRHSRTIESWKNKYPKKSHLDIPAELFYAELDLHCIHGGKYVKSVAKEDGRPNQRSNWKDCPSVIKLRLSPDGKYLVIKDMDEDHNHEINEEPEAGTLDEGPYLTLEVKEPPREGVVLLEGYGSPRLTPRMWCALESAARAHPNTPVSLLMTSIILKESLLLQVLRKELSNLQFLHLNTDHLFQDTLLEFWYKDKMWESSYWPKSHFNDVLRWMILWRYGGIYFDLDVVVLRSLSSLPNCTGMESHKWAAAGVLKFTPEHPVIEACIEKIAEHFDGTVWGANGPELLTEVLQQMCGMELPSGKTPLCPDVKVMPTRVFYPIPWWDWQKYVTDNEALSRDLLNDETVHVLHMWNLHTRHARLHMDSHQPYAHAARIHCPTTVKYEGPYM